MVAARSYRVEEAGNWVLRVQTSGYRMQKFWSSDAHDDMITPANNNESYSSNLLRE
jgi:hypothetical protein